YNGTVDIGAFESQLAPSRTTFTVTNTGDSGPGSLRQAVQDNNQMGGGNTIAFALPPAVTITLSRGELPIIQDVTISGPGADQLAVSGNDSSRVFTVYDRTFPFYQSSSFISGLTIDHGASASQDGGGGVCV